MARLTAIFMIIAGAEAATVNIHYRLPMMPVQRL